MSVLIIDVGTSSIRVARAAPDGSLSGERRVPALPISVMETAWSEVNWAPIRRIAVSRKYKKAATGARRPRKNRSDT